MDGTATEGDHTRAQGPRPPDGNDYQPWRQRVSLSFSQTANVPISTSVGLIALPEDACALPSVRVAHFLTV